MKKRILASLLSVVMVLTMLPTALAAEWDISQDAPPDTSLENVETLTSDETPPSAEGLCEVYWNASSGSDEKDGKSKDTAVKTLAKAKKLLAENGTIYLCSSVTVTGIETWSLEDCGEATVQRYGYDGDMIELAENASLTLEHIILDGTDASLEEDSELGDAIIKSDSPCSLTLNDGCILQNNHAQTMGVAICGWKQMNLTMNDGAVIQGNKGDNASYGGAVFLANGSTFTMDGGEIKNNVGNRGGGVALICSEMTMNGGTISGNKTYPVLNNSDGYGGGIYIADYEDISGVGGTPNRITAGEASFTMMGGSITGNEAQNYGGGILAYPQGDRSSDGRQTLTINIQGGEISENKVTKGSGGGIALFFEESHLNMSNGTISQNTAYKASGYGGGVFLYGTSSENVQITGGTISGNSAWRGGGLALFNTGTSAAMSGGEITGNQSLGMLGNGGGIYLGGTLNLSGGTISGNTAAHTLGDTDKTYSNGIYLSKTSGQLGSLNLSGETKIDRADDIAIEIASETDPDSTSNRYINIDKAFTGASKESPVSITSVNLGDPSAVIDTNSKLGTKLVVFQGGDAGGQSGAKKAGKNGLFVPSEAMLAVNSELSINQSSTKKSWLTYKEADPELITWYYEVLYQSYNINDDLPVQTDEDGYPYIWKTWTFGNNGAWSNTTASISPEQYSGENGVMGWDDVSGKQKEQIGVHYIYDKDFPNTDQYRQRLSAKASEATADNPLTIYYRAARNDVIYKYEGEIPEGANSVLPATKEAPYKATVKIEDAPALDGYVFSGWKVESPDYMDALMGDGTFTMPNEDVTLVGSWEKAHYVLYEFKSGTRGASLIDKITDMLPLDDDTYAIGAAVTAILPEELSFIGPKTNNDGAPMGVWTFEGYKVADNKVPVNDDNQVVLKQECLEKGKDESDPKDYLVFTGTWKWRKGVPSITLTPQDMSAYTGGDSLSGDSFPTVRYKIEAGDIVDLSKVTFTVNGQKKALPEGTKSGDIVVLDWLDDTFTLDESASMGISTLSEDEKLEATHDGVAGEYTISANTEGISGKIGEVPVTLKVEEGELTVRNVSDPKGVLEETVDVAQPVVSDASKVNTDDGIGIAVIPNGTSYYTNGKEELGVLGDNDSEHPQIALLFDKLLPGEDGEDTAQLLIDHAEKNGHKFVEGQYEFRYLDLINENDGNAWVSVDDSTTITIYWPCPEGVTAENFTAQVLHFKGLHREYRANLEQQINASAIEEIQATIEGENIVFQLKGDKDIGSFSPFVLAWTEKEAPAVHCTVTFQPGDHGTLSGAAADGNVQITDIVSGTKLTADQIPAVNANSKYSFTGWLGSDGKTYSNSDILALAIISNMTFTAQYKKDSGGGGGGGGTTYYILHYESNGGTKYKDERYARNTVVELDKVPTREGYTFTGWYADKELTERITEIKMTSNKTVYAGWEPTGVPDWLNGKDHFAYVVGYEDGTVRPLADISRAEVATIFFRLLNEDIRKENLTSVNSFEDVEDGTWYNTAVSTMAKLGIVKGRSPERFDPDASITRAEFAAICARFDTSKRDGDSNFTDIAGHWAEAEIERAATLGWIMGYTDGTFRPENYITRAEAMTMINRVLNRLPESEDDLLDGMNVWPDNQPGAWYYLAVQEATNSHDFNRKGDVHEHWTKLTADPDWTKYQ